MTINSSSTLRYPKKAKPIRVDLDIQAIDEHIESQGVHVMVTPSMLCPNRDRVDSTNHSLTCSVCNGNEAVDLICKRFETVAILQSIKNDKLFQVQGLYDHRDYLGTFLSSVRLFYGTRVEIISQSTPFNEVVKRDDDDTDKLRYRYAEQSTDTPCYLIDSYGVQYEKDVHYMFIKDNDEITFVKWLTNARPVVDSLYSIYYPIYPTLRVIDSIHSARLYEATTKSPDRVPVNLPMNVVLRWDYISYRSGSREESNLEPT